MMKINFLTFVVIFLFSLTNCAETSIKEIKTEITNAKSETEQSKIETSEEKAVRLAEEFIKRNGYTDTPADKDNLAHETVEFYDNIDELLEQRKNTLEKKAFGIFFQGKHNEKGWTVAFRYNKKQLKDLSDKEYNSLGRSVTMDENFENLRVEHQSLFLQKVDKKF